MTESRKLILENQILIMQALLQVRLTDDTQIALAKQITRVEEYLAKEQIRRG